MTDTQSSTLAPSPPAGAEVVAGEAELAAAAGLAIADRASRKVSTAVVSLLALVLLAVVVAGVLPSSWFAQAPNRRLEIDQPAPYARAPASAQPVDERISIGDLGDAAEQFPPDGDFYFVTVMAPDQSLLSWVVGRDEPAIEFVTYEDVNGFDTPTQRRTIDLAMMASSEQTAQFVALQRVGFDVTIELGEVIIADIVCLEPATDPAAPDPCARWAPSDAVIDPGDRIKEVEGVEIQTVEDLSEVLKGREPGDVVSMVIERPDRGRLEVEAELTVSPSEPERTIVGFEPVDTRRVNLPFELDIDTGEIGGPSAGLAFTLTLIDELTPGELTGGRAIAVTGTIELDGSVGPIGGLPQKASAVQQAGVDAMLVPDGQRDEDIAAARRAAPEVEIIEVANLDEALAALERFGGDPLPPPDPTDDSSG